MIKIDEEELIRLQHYPPDERYSVLGQLLNHLVFSQDSAWTGDGFDQLILSLSRMSEKTVYNYLFPYDDREETEEWIISLLNEATTEEEVYEVMIDILLNDAIRESAEPEPQ